MLSPDQIEAALILLSMSGILLASGLIASLLSLLYFNLKGRK